MVKKVEVSVIVPAYNEGQHIRENLARISRAVSAFADAYEIVVVDDGSTDDTKEEIVTASEEDRHIRPASYKENGGKGKAIRTGIRLAKGTWIAFLDADLDLPPEQLEHFISELRKGGVHAVIGSKMHPESHIEYPLVRRLMSMVYYRMLKGLFHLEVKDTQTGIKAFDARALKYAASRMRTSGYAYDIEILATLAHKGLHIRELPVELKYSRNKKMGRIRIKDIFRTFTDTLRIRIWMQLGQYD